MSADTIPTADALLAAIAAHPEEDTPRLMYADYLQESGQEDRAELIRVQIDLEQWVLGYLSHDEQSCSVLRVREAAILARHPDWLRVTCPACGGKGTVPDPPGVLGIVPMLCLFCSGAGHLPLVYRRGFPWRVTVPRLELVGVERRFCRACRESRGEWNEIDRHSYCARCDSNHPIVVVTAIPRFVPTDHTRELLAVLPTCGELVPGDREPDSFSLPEQHGWWNAASYSGSGQHALFEPSDLPQSVWERLTGFDSCSANDEGYRYWLTSDAAISALGVTLCGIVRGSA